MNGKRRRSSYNKVEFKNKKIMRCKRKMVPVFQSDNCEQFFKKENTDNNICKNCQHSF